MGKYLIRFDDICPTMRWSVWDRVEEILLSQGVRPILAVVPDNCDHGLEFEPPRADFWERVRSWQARGWTIGMHGYQHRLSSNSSGIVGIKKRSEFAGVSPEEQRVKLSRGAEIFRREGVVPQVWIAPWHSFDRATLELLPGVGITRVSDGLFLRPHVDRAGLLWVPQQIWRFRRLPFGVWTLCFHPNLWSPRQLENFARDVARYREEIVSFDDAVQDSRAFRALSGYSLLPPIMRGLIRLRAGA